MIAPHSPAPEEPAPEGLGPKEPASGDTERSTEPTEVSGTSVSTLRGAGVEVDVRRVGRVVGALCLVALAVVAIVLFVAGVNKNDQITRLRQHGVDVAVTVTGCLGLLGGSGSNAAGDECKGTFALAGHRYNEDIPGNSIRTPGSTIRAIAVTGNPPLLATARAVATDRPSWHVFVVPTILIVVDVLVVGVVVVRRRRVHSPSLPDNGAR